MDLCRPQPDCLAKYFAHYSPYFGMECLEAKSSGLLWFDIIHSHNLICYVHGQTIPLNNLTTNQNKQFMDR